MRPAVRASRVACRVRHGGDGPTRLPRRTRRRLTGAGDDARGDSCQPGRIEPLRRGSHGSRDVRKLQQQVESLADAQARTKAWATCLELEFQCSRLFADYLDLVSGIALRASGRDDGLCRIADALISDFDPFGTTSWGSLTVPASRELREDPIASFVRLGFPEWSVWTLPLAMVDFSSSPHPRAPEDREPPLRRGRANRDHRRETPADTGHGVGGDRRPPPRAPDRGRSSRRASEGFLQPASRNARPGVARDGHHGPRIRMGRTPDARRAAAGRRSRRAASPQRGRRDAAAARAEGPRGGTA